VDLHLQEAEATAEEMRAISLVAPETEVEVVPGRVVRSGREARSLRHLLLPALAAVQSEVGWVSPPALNEIGRRLSVPPADAYGVASFYSLISTEPRPKGVAHVCDDIACRNAGGLELLAALDDAHPSPCLGQCDRRPAVYLQRAGNDDVVLTRASAGAVRAVLDGTVTVPVPGDPAPQTTGRRVLAGVGRVDPESLDDYRRQGGYRGLEAALRLGREGVIG
jgi:NADH-quinone oxidoreductase subunit F